MAQLILGVDPGAAGALAVVEPDTNQLVDVFDVPLRDDGDVDGPALLASLGGYASRIQAVVFEEQHSRAGNSIRATFTHGDNTGQLKSALRMILPAHADWFFVRPSVWKAALGLSKSKRKSVTLAQKTWPASASLFVGPRGGLRDGRAEAALLTQLARA